MMVSISFGPLRQFPARHGVPERLEVRTRLTRVL
jgi:hypothetical protein